MVKYLMQVTGATAAEILEEAVDALRQRIVLEMGNRSYDALRGDPEGWAAWQQELAERAAIESVRVDAEASANLTNENQQVATSK